MTSEILRFSEKPVIDESIQEYEYHEYEPQARTNLNSAGEININIDLQNLFTHPVESYIVFQGRLTKTDGTAYANTDNVVLTNNGLMYLFSNISYRLSSQEIESVHPPGQATTMLGLLWKKDTATTAVVADNAGFNARSYLIATPTAKGTFSFRVPLKHIFGFCITIKSFTV